MKSSLFSIKEALKCKKIKTLPDIPPKTLFIEGISSTATAENKYILAAGYP